MVFDKIKELWDSFFEATGVAIIGDYLPAGKFERDDVLDVPGYKQTQTFSCGFVAGLMVLHTFKPRASINSFWEKVRPSESSGVSTTRLIEALRSSGIGVGIINDVNFLLFKRAISKGRPVITLVKTNDVDTDHWVVVYGVGENPKRIFVAGNGLPYLSKKMISWNHFQKAHEFGEDRISLLGKITRTVQEASNEPSK